MGAPPVPSKSARQTRSTMSQGRESKTLTFGLDANTVTEASTRIPRNPKKSTIPLKFKAKKNNASSQSREGSSDGADGGDDTDETPDSSEVQDEDEQGAVIAPSCDQKKTGHKTGRQYNRSQRKGSERIEKGAMAKTPTPNAMVASKKEKRIQGAKPKVQHATPIEESEKTQEEQTTDSDDDDYRGVDDISESDESDDELERLEEEMIIASYQAADKDDDYPTLSHVTSSGWNSFGVGDQLFLASESFFEDLSDAVVDDDAMLPSNFDSEQPETPRRVHFADEVVETSNDSSSSDTESNQFSDTFLQQDRLAPSLLHRIEHDSADEDQSLSENEWDVTHDGLLEYEHFGLDNDDDSITSGSDYESTSLPGVIVSSLC
jgi:hypothetical protein